MRHVSWPAGESCPGPLSQARRSRTQRAASTAPLPPGLAQGRRGRSSIACATNACSSARDWPARRSATSTQRGASSSTCAARAPSPAAPHNCSAARSMPMLAGASGGEDAPPPCAGPATRDDGHRVTGGSGSPQHRSSSSRVRSGKGGRPSCGVPPYAAVHPWFARTPGGAHGGRGKGSRSRTTRGCQHIVWGRGPVEDGHERQAGQRHSGCLSQRPGRRAVDDGKTAALANAPMPGMLYVSLPRHLAF